MMDLGLYQIQQATSNNEKVWFITRKCIYGAHTVRTDRTVHSTQFFFCLSIRWVSGYYYDAIWLNGWILVYCSNLPSVSAVVRDDDPSFDRAQRHCRIAFAATITTMTSNSRCFQQYCSKYFFFPQICVCFLPTPSNALNFSKLFCLVAERQWARTRKFDHTEKSFYFFH